MLEYLLRLENTLADKSFVTEVRVGDYINLSDWLRDVYAEVIAVLKNDHDPKRSSVLVITYGRGGKFRKLEHITFKQIHKVTKLMPMSGIMFERCRYVNYYTNAHASWPVDVYPVPKYSHQYL